MRPRVTQPAAVLRSRRIALSISHPLWIVRRTMIDVIRPIQFQDVLRLRRWCSGTSSRWCEIRVRIDGRNGGLIESEAFWININRATLMPSRITRASWNGCSAPLTSTVSVGRPTLRPGTARMPTRSANTRSGSPTSICSTT